MDNITGSSAISDFCDKLEKRLEALSEGSRKGFRIRVAGKTIEIRTPDSALSDMLFGYIAIPEAGEDAVPEAVFSFWRDDCSRFAPSGTDEGDGVWLLRQDQGVIILTLPNDSLLAADYENERYYLCADHGSPADTVDYGHPIPQLFGRWAMNSSLLMLHSACVGIDGKGVLIAAAGGGGKSTLAVSCLMDGFDFISDDYVLVSREGPLTARPLYRTVGLNPDMRRELDPDMPVLRTDKDRGGKLLLDASAYPFRKELSVRAIVHPVIAGLKEPEIRRVKQGPVLVKLIHTTAQQLDYIRDPEPYRIMSQRLSCLPVYEIRLSGDLERNRERLRIFIEKELQYVQNQ